tara:strand:+ start:1677 stop:2195 length:519 start_codon:yes stop_codon:yes gene_type:complete
MSTIIPQKSPRFSQLQLASSGIATPASVEGIVNSHVLEYAFFSSPISLNANSNKEYLVLDRPSSICSFIIQATISRVISPDYLDPLESRPFTHYIFTSGTDISNSIEYENLNSIPYNTWFYSTSATAYFPNPSSFPNRIILKLPLVGNSTTSPSYHIQGTMKIFVTPYIDLP